MTPELFNCLMFIVERGMNAIGQLDEFAVDYGSVLEVKQPCNNHETHLAATNMPVSLFGTAYPTHVNYILNLQIYI